MTARIVVTLPYPISANRYWRQFTIGKRVMSAPSSDATKYKRDVALLCRASGVCKPISGRVAIDVRLFPHRPQDWAKRQRLHGATWDDSVQCIDLDNANKVLLDALKGVAIDDDKWVRRLTSERMEPDGEARVVVTISQLLAVAPQLDLLEVA